MREKEKEASRKRQELEQLREYDVLAADDGIVVDEEELRGFGEDSDGEDEAAAEARLAAAP